MSNVVLSIGGRSFSVACADGEEQHIETLGKVIDRKVLALGNTAGQNEVRMLLYAALVLADELHEASASPSPAPAAPTMEPGLPESLERIAATLENLATRLEHRRDLPGTSRSNIPEAISNPWELSLAGPWSGIYGAHLTSRRQRISRKPTHGGPATQLRQIPIAHAAAQGPA